MPLSTGSYRRLDSSKYGYAETDGICGLQQTNDINENDEDLVGYSLNFSQPKYSFVGHVKTACGNMRRRFNAALRCVLKIAFGKWPIALIILITYIALTAGLIVIALTGKYHEFRKDISLDSFMVPDIKVSSDLAAFNAAKENGKTRYPSSLRMFLSSETCTGNKINPLRKRWKRSPFIQERPSWTLNLVYVAKGGDSSNIFTKERLQEIHNIEKTLMKHGEFKKHCFISRLSSQDENLDNFGNCSPLNSMTNFFYPSKGRVFDGQGDILASIPDTLKFLRSRKYFFSYVSDDFNKYNRSEILRAQILFGNGEDGIANGKLAQKQEFKRYVRTYVDTLDKLNNNNQVSILYGGGDLFDFLVDKALISDIRLAAVSLGLIIVLLLILTFSWWLSFVAVLSIVSSVACAYFFYRVVFGIEYMGILNGVSLFVIIGIGVDDIFVFINTFRQAVDNKDLGDRIVHTISVAGVATFFTSFTTAVAFGANALSPIPAIHDFGVFMAILVASCWVSVLFIMSPALVLWHVGIEKLESVMCNKVLSVMGVKRSEHFRLPDDIRRFLSGISNIGSGRENSEAEHEEIPLVNNDHDGDDDDDDDEPLLVLDNESPASTSSQTSLYGTDSIGFRLQSILYHFVAIPVIKARVVIFVTYIFLLAGSAFLITKLQVSKEQPKFFKADSNLQRWLELPEVSLISSGNEMIQDIGNFKQRTSVTTTPHMHPRPKHTKWSKVPTTVYPRRTSTIKQLPTRKTPFTKPKKASTRKHPVTTEQSGTKAATTQVKTERSTAITHFKSTMKGLTTSTFKPTTTVVPSVTGLTTLPTNSSVNPKRRCPNCAVGATCNNVTFTCECQTFYTGETCSKYCPVRTMTGECCAIPFMYKNEMQQGCLIEEESGKPWCSLTADFDTDQQKGFCNKTAEHQCARLTKNGTCCQFPFVYEMIQYFSCIKLKDEEGTYCAFQPAVSSRDELVQCKSPGPSPTPSLCSKGDCTPVKPPPNEATALVYLVFGIKGIDKSSVDLRHVLKETKGKALYDKSFSKDMSCNSKLMIKSACRICKKFSGNKELVKPGGSECFPKAARQALAERFPYDCQDLPGDKKSSQKIKSYLVIRNGTKVEWFAMAFSSTTGKLSSFGSQRKDYQKWEEQLKEVLNDVPDSMKSGFQTSETWVKMFSGIIVVNSAVYGIVVSLLLCVAAVIIFTGHALLFVILFLTILGVLLMVTAIFYLTGWQLGGVEAISLSILVGTSVDYSFHLVEGYILAGEAVDSTLDNMAARQWRAKAAMSHIGMSIFSSAITTILAAIPLCLTQIQLFAKFGLIVTINTGISILYTVTVTMAMLSIFGPPKFRGKFLSSFLGFLVVGGCLGIGYLILYLVSTVGGHCIQGPSGTPLFKC